MESINAIRISKEKFRVYPLKFKVARVIKGFTLDRLAQEAGITRKTISKIENGKCFYISSRTYNKLVSSLGQDEDFFKTPV